LHSVSEESLAEENSTSSTADSIQEKTVAIQRRIPIRHEVDVFVAGGGPAGVAASVAAARQGCSVFLAERQNCFGGMGTAALVPVFQNFGDGVNLLVGGVGHEILTQLREAGGTGPGSSVTIRPETLKRVYDHIVREAGVQFTFETQFIDVETDSEQVKLAILAAKSGLFAVRARYFIDCTGDGDLCVWAGAPFEKGDKDGNVMAGTLCSIWADIDWEAARKFGMGNQEKLLPEAFKNHVFTKEDRHLPGMYRIGNHLGGGNIGHTFGVDGTDESSVTEALIWGRKVLLEYERYYKEYLKGFEQMELVITGSALGIRETRRIMGDYVLDLNDFQKRAVFDDEIGRYTYPVDIHASRSGDEAYQEYKVDFDTLRYGKGESYGVPYRILTPKKLSNVWVAGRCVSTDRYMQSSIRVMPGCYLTGQAAGTAAAIAGKKDTDARGVSVTELQQQLKQAGMYLPNC
jgi:hypothetical protein